MKSMTDSEKTKYIALLENRVARLEAQIELIGLITAGAQPMLVLKPALEVVT